MTTAADRYIEAFVRFHRRANRDREAADARPVAARDEPAADHGSEATTRADASAGAQASEPQGPEPIDWDDKLTHAALSELKDDLYSNLDTLDGKASGLLSYCGLVLAGSAILLDRGGNTISVAIIATVALTAALSAFLGVFVIFVKWTPTDRLERARTIDACRQYFGVRQRRTWLYLFSWLTIVVSTAAFILYLVVSLATGNAVRMDVPAAPAQQAAGAETPDGPPAEAAAEDGRP